MKKDKTRKKSSAYKKYRRHKILFITELIFDSAAGIWLFVCTVRKETGKY